MPEYIPIDLNKKTVFVLGAGASKPYNFPIGIELKQQIASNIIGRTPLVNLLYKCGIEQSLIDKFIEALPRTSAPTIDIFLEKKSKFRELGAIAIAYFILVCENQSNNFLFPRKDWYSHLFTILDLEKYKPDLENITFITLNYDRSLEYFLDKCIEYDCSEELVKNAGNKISKLKIIHLHGSLGPYSQVGYGATPDNENILNSAANGIRIVSDQLEDSMDFLNAQIALKNANNLVFLGFGYDPTTLKRLTVNTNFSDKRVLGTVLGLNQPNLDYLKLYFSHFEYIQTNISAEIFVKKYLPLPNV